jgi:competence protein ComEC
VFVACDVGQGDALVLNAGAHAAVEIDAGPDPVLIDRCLRDLGIVQIPLLVLTHFHLDHVGGLPGVGRGRPVGAVLTGPLDEPPAGSALVQAFARQQQVPVRSPPVGTKLRVGAVRLQVLGPPSAFHGTRSDPNNSSLVLRADVGGIRIMLPGDAEIEAQQALLDSGADLRADVLKVPHHGSAYSDPDFLAAVQARLAVVSVGIDNDYGHPSPILLDEMARLGVPLLRTDQDGDVAVVARNGQLGSVVRGVRASTVGLGRPRLRTPVTVGGLHRCQKCFLPACLHLCAIQAISSVSNGSASSPSTACIHADQYRARAPPTQRRADSAHCGSVCLISASASSRSQISR